MTSDFYFGVVSLLLVLLVKSLSRRVLSRQSTSVLGLLVDVVYGWFISVAV